MEASTTGSRILPSQRRRCNRIASASTTNMPCSEIRIDRIGQTSAGRIFEHFDARLAAREDAAHDLGGPLHHAELIFRRCLVHPKEDVIIERKGPRSNIAPAPIRAREVRARLQGLSWVASEPSARHVFTPIDEAVVQAERADHGRMRTEAEGFTGEPYLAADRMRCFVEDSQTVQKNIRRRRQRRSWGRCR